MAVPIRRRKHRSHGISLAPPEVRTITTDDTIRTDEEGEDDVILCDCTAGAITVTLPKVSDRVNYRYIIKKIDSSGNAVTIDGDGSETIDGAATQPLTTQWDALELVTDETAWFIVGKVA